MDSINPFYKKDQEELRQVSLILFSSGDVTCNDEIYEYYKKWQFLFNMFMDIVDRKNGGIRLPPFSCGYLDQPYKTTQILRYLNSMWIEHIISENEKAMNRR